MIHFDMPSHAVFAFWPFASPWLLMWGFAAAAPIIIHLWSRRKYREVTWAAMEYLLAAVRKNARRIQVEQLILLLIRTAILLFLAAALADPVLSPLFANRGGGGRTHWVLVFDSSYSMDARRDGVSRLDETRRLALELIDESRQGDGFTVIAMADPPDVLIADPAFDRADVQREIDELRLRHTGAQLEPTLAEVAAIVQRAELRHSRLNETRVCFFTDMGKTTWDDALSADARKWWTQLSESATLQLFDVGVNEVINRSIARIAARQQLVTPRRDVTFDVEVVQRGGSAERSWVEFFSDGNRVERRSLDVGPNQPAAVSFTVRFDEPGDHYIECRLPDDDLPLDNSRWRSVRVRKDVRVLCIEGKPGAARHVALALAPQKEASARRVIVDTATETALLESDLHQYAAIFLCNVAQFREEEASALHRYVQRGGATVFFLGDQVNSENYNERLASDSSHPLLPCTLGSAISGSQYMFDPRGYHHPLLEAFRGHEQAGLLTTPVWKYIQLTTLTENGGQTALEFEGGDPAIVDGMSGRGRCLVVATAASTESVSPGADPPYWSAMSSWPSFLPLTQELLQAGLSRRADERNRTVGEPLFGEAPPQTKDVAVSVALPRDDGRPAVDTARAERVTLTKVDTQLTWGFAETYWSGIYTAEFQTPERSARYFAANVDVREGDPTRIAPGEIPSQLQRDYTADGATASPGFNAGGQSFFRYLLAIVFGLVLCESFLASQFGRTWK